MNVDPLLVMTTCANAEEARALATALVDERLAACVNAVPGVRSTYRWEDKVEHAEECLLFIKTTRERLASLEQAIKARSSYELPEVVAVSVDGGSAAYLQWVQDCVAR